MFQGNIIKSIMFNNKYINEIWKTHILEQRVNFINVLRDYESHRNELEYKNHRRNYRIYCCYPTTGTLNCDYCSNIICCDCFYMLRNIENKPDNITISCHCFRGKHFYFGDISFKGI